RCCQIAVVDDFRRAASFSPIGLFLGACYFWRERCLQDAWSSALPVAIGEISCHERASCCICRRRAALCADCSSAKGVCHGAVEVRVVEGGVHIRVGACGLYGFCCDSGLSAVKGALALRRLTRWGSCAKRLSPAKGACAQRE